MIDFTFCSLDLATRGTVFMNYGPTICACSLVFGIVLSAHRITPDMMSYYFRSSVCVFVLKGNILSFSVVS